ncbi:MlaA family lipoprotein [Ramlibacter albus]|uniref:VacJ family lipoprotein n=1 Tax=Ramlibacter albus TaxID=2079448 RepID=A0A923M977_9BURK|nr:VacJ family lipoprotein [Ramlibacter albus]MBC5764822.1 VacJ family lipoprotein [Ramlibacter albus]
MKIKKLFVLALAAVALAGLGGCASLAERNPADPFEPMNREITKFNDGLDQMLLKPVATAYRRAVPPLVRTGVSNFFGNLGDLWSAANSALQLKIPNAFENLMRFHVNTVFGLGGILDLASEFNIERHKEDFGQTLGRYGVPAGPYIVLPFLGPSTLRDTLALPVDRRGDLVHYTSNEGVRHTLYGIRAVDQRANLLRVGEVLNEASLDRYTFTRDAYLQRRRAEIGREKQDDRTDGQTPKDEPPAQTPGQPASAPTR